MNALNELLTQNLNEAIELARASGRLEIADYLTLKSFKRQNPQRKRQMAFCRCA